jgi:hypothetical protein
LVGVPRSAAAAVGITTARVAILVMVVCLFGPTGPAPVLGADATTQTATESPIVRIDPPSAVGTTEATISGSVNPNGDSASWRVQVSRDPTCVGGYENQPLQNIAVADSPVEIEYHLTGLLPAEHYCVRLLATNGAGGTTSDVEEFTTLEAAPTQVFTAFAAPRTDTGVRLNGYINPQGSEASYRFEYSVDGSNWTVLPDRQSRPARTQIVVGQEVAGLEPDTVYRYRFSAESGGGPAAPQGGPHTFRTRTTAEMQRPERGIELVNAPDKGNQNVLPSVFFRNMSPVRTDGGAVLWTVIGGAPGGNTPSEPVFLATRTSTGWRSRSIVPDPEEQFGGGSLAFKLNESNAAFTRFLFRAVRPAPLFSVEGPPTFVTVDDNGNEQVLRSFPEASGFQAWINTETTDDMARGFLVPFNTDQLEELGAPGSLSVMPDGLPSNCGLEGSSSFTGDNGESVAARQWRPGYHRIDKLHGSRVYFQSVANGASCGSNMGVYVRDLITGTTTEIDSGSATPGPEVIRATPDGGALYFVTGTSHVSEDKNTHWDVYRWDAGSGDYLCLTCVVPDAEVAGNVLVSDEFSHIYFFSRRQLVSGHGEPGEANLYVLNDGKVRFVTDLGSTETLRRPYSELSANGNVFIFRTTGSGNEELTADPMAAGGCETAGQPGSLGSCQELYRYEASTESLECLSCRQDAPTDTTIGSPGAENWHAVSADGQTVAFVTKEPLLRRDVNDGVDVYEWHSGRLGLITDGLAQYPENGLNIAPKVYGMDAAGDDIFFTVVAPAFTGYEQDGLVNLYDARVGGGFPRPRPPVRCAGELCQGPLEAAPEQPAAGSASLHGSRKPRHSRRCPRGKARRHGRCVKHHRRKP